VRALQTRAAPFQTIGVIDDDDDDNDDDDDE
jgi:hypothetical protein